MLLGGIDCVPTGRILHGKYQGKAVQPDPGFVVVVVVVVVVRQRWDDGDQIDVYAQRHGTAPHLPTRRDRALRSFTISTYRVRELLYCNGTYY
jgi:hypothetical protein